MQVCESFIDWIANGNFDIFHNILSIFYKFVSPFLYVVELCVWILDSRIEHNGLYDDDTIVII